ncbi:MAG: hypothetical protein CTY16_20185 [Methylobacter sp.]|nr:MAG: hypothetical protein CTY16_20185 [Methylobacter sp.]
MEALYDAVLSEGHNPHEIRCCAENNIFSIINGYIANKIDKRVFEIPPDSLYKSGLIKAIFRNNHDNQINK